MGPEKPIAKKTNWVWETQVEEMGKRRVLKVKPLHTVKANRESAILEAMEEGRTSLKKPQEFLC